MKRLIAPLAVLGLMALAAPASASPPIDAAAFAEDCNDDGLVHVTDHLKVFGGTGFLNDGVCVVQMDPGTKLTMKDAALNGDAAYLVVADAQEETQVSLLRTTIFFTSDDDSAVQLSPGCCAGEPEPGRDESDALVRVSDSLLRAGTVEVSGSTAADGGTALVKRSTLKGAATWSSDPVVVHASLTGVGGTAAAEDSTFISPTGIRIATGDAGTTVATGNQFMFGTAVTITTGAGGTCTSSGNTPPVACT